MTTKQWIKELRAKPSTKYSSRYEVAYYDIDLSHINLSQIPIPFGVVNRHFNCYRNELISLYNAPIEVDGDFLCRNNQLTTLDHLPKYIGGDLVCQDNPFQNLNGLKGIQIKGIIWFSHETEEQLNYWIKALYNTNLDVLEYHYNNHKYKFWLNSKLENYIKDVLEEIIKIKTMKNHLNL